MITLTTGTLAPFSLNLIQDIQQMLIYTFMRQAFLAGTILSVVAGLVGYFVVLRHQTFAAEALSDVAFAGALGGAALGIDPLVTLLAATITAALAMGRFGERLGNRDVAIGTTLAWVLGLGVLFLSLFGLQGSANGSGISGVTVLFGDILGISAEETLAIALISLLVVLAMATLIRPLLFASLDPDVAAARGVPVRALGLGFMVLLALTVSEATLAVGALLVFALLLLPAAIAHQLTTRPYVGMALASGLAILLTWLGIAIGFYTGLPSSASVSLLAFLSYAAVIGGGALRGTRRRAALVIPVDAAADL